MKIAFLPQSTWCFFVSPATINIRLSGNTQTPEAPCCRCISEKLANKFSLTVNTTSTPMKQAYSRLENHIENTYIFYGVLNQYKNKKDKTMKAVQCLFSALLTAFVGTSEANEIANVSFEIRGRKFGLQLGAEKIHARFCVETLKRGIY